MFSLFLALASVQDSAPIIVTGQVGDARRALEACLARKCPPLEDMAASLRYAEAQFVAGQYQGARKTLKGATDRNRGFAAEHPREVAGLYRAASRVAAHLGEGDESESRAFGMMRAMKAGLPDQSPEVLLARLEVAKTQANFNKVAGAIITLEGVCSAAEASGQRLIYGIAAIRLAALKDIVGGKSEAKRLLRPITGWTEPEMAQVRFAARLLLARLEDGPEAMDKLIAELRSAPGQPPVLLKMAPLKIDWYDPRGARQGVGEVATVKVEQWYQPRVDQKWADIGFWVRPDGTVDDVDVLRESGAEKFWIDPIVAQTKSRVYAKAANPAGPAVYRVERFTLTALWDKLTGTHQRVRAPAYRVERLDLTADPAPKSAEPAGAK
ncbi:hypothetical protein [Sphingomonas sp.]|uniref:hypothetical protein n=1 Tax=Sphingomonas sp. TaxID=28214 RepID=UPI001EBFBCFA|nr:hypothetical protein [Sphingomonas sp.]MBX3594014.1 hypothetical protein [Sphingomonas sp.]